jgi:hypothetical protein
MTAHLAALVAKTAIDEEVARVSKLAEEEKKNPKSLGVPESVLFAHETRVRMLEAALELFEALPPETIVSHRDPIVRPPAAAAEPRPKATLESIRAKAELLRKL